MPVPRTAPQTPDGEGALPRVFELLVDPTVLRWPTVGPAHEITDGLKALLVVQLPRKISRTRGAYLVTLDSCQQPTI
jgi:hypothetical protein